MIGVSAPETRDGEIKQCRSPRLEIGFLEYLLLCSKSPTHGVKSFFPMKLIKSSYNCRRSSGKKLSTLLDI